MLDRAKPADQVLNETDEQPEAELVVDKLASSRASWLQWFIPNSLAGRIALINLLGLAMLTVGILYFNQLRQGLIDARAQSLMTQAQIISAAVAGSATADTGDIFITPDEPQDFSTDAQSDVEQLKGIDFPISPESASPIIRRLLANTNIRARIIDQDGNLIVDSKFFYSGSDITQSDLTSSAKNPQNGWVQWTTNLVNWFFSYDYPAVVEYGFDNNNQYLEIGAALNGASASIVRLDENKEIIVLVAVPVQRFRAVLGALVLSTEGGEIDRVLRSERNIVFMTFGFSTLVTLLLSALLAGTIATPIRKLSEAAERVRKGISKRVEIPDFTARKDEIGDLSGSIRDMTSALYNRIDAIEAFAADVSHELKNPLTSLRSAVETLEFVKRDDQRQRLIEIVKHDVKRMDRLITDISDASRLDAELARTEAEPVDIAKLLGAIVLIINETSDGKSAEILLTVQPMTARSNPEGHYQVLGQSSRLGQVFRNLVDNAQSFSPPNSKINIHIRRRGPMIEVRVDDAGSGIRPDNLERVFERFYTDRPEESFGKNSGLGLAISRQIVEAHKGRIWAENRLGRASELGERTVLGARFIVQLPALPVDWNQKKDD
jgi:two-component system, OmpR family, sensor histidine kinase ChvG